MTTKNPRISTKGSKKKKKIGIYLARALDQDSNRLRTGSAVFFYSELHMRSASAVEQGCDNKKYGQQYNVCVLHSNVRIIEKVKQKQQNTRYNISLTQDGASEGNM